MKVQDPVFAAERSLQFATLRRRVDEGIRALERGEVSLAIEAFASAYAIAAAWDFGDDVTYGTLLNLAMAHSAAGNFRAALEAYRLAASLPRLTGEQRASLANHMGVAHMRQGDHRRAAFFFAQGYRLARRSGNRRLRALTAANTALACRHMADAARGRRWAERAVREARGTDLETRTFAQIQLCACELAAGRVERASTLLSHLDDASVDVQSELFLLRAELARHRNQPEIALCAAARAADLAVRERSPEDLAEATRLLRSLSRGRLRPLEPARLQESLRLHQEWLTAFYASCAEILGRDTKEREVALLFCDRSGLILAREGDAGGLERATRLGLVVGVRKKLVDPHPRPRPYAWHPVEDESGRAGFVIAVSAGALLARAAAALTARIHRGRTAELRRAEEQLTLNKLATFHDVALAVGGPLETHELVTQLIALTRQAVSAPAAAIVFTAEQQGAWSEGLSALRLSESPVVKRVAETGRALRLSPDDPRARPLLEGLRVAALMAVPVYFGSSSCGAVLVAARYEPRAFSEQEVELVTFISKQFGLALENAALRDDLRRRLDMVTHDLQVARRLQLAMMPQEPVRTPGVTIAGLSLPAKHVGGDVYDYSELGDGGWVAVIGDVMGKGVAAAMLGSILHARVRQALREEAVGPGLVERLRAVMWDDLHRARALATLAVMHYDEQARRLTILTAGHLGPVMWRDGEWVAVAPGGGTALGLQSSGGMVGTAEAAATAGDLLLLYTDGFGELLMGRRGLVRSDTVARALRRLDGLRPQEGALAFLEDVRRLARDRELTDDVTVVAVQIGGHGDRGRR